MLEEAHDGFGPPVTATQAIKRVARLSKPLSVLRDLARETGFDLPENLMDSHDRLTAFSQVFESAVAPPMPTVFLSEDIHWADDATIDFLRYLTRRVAGTRVMILLTARTDEMKGSMTVRRIMGNAVSQDARRLDLKPFSEAIVARLAIDAGKDPDKLLEVAAGNPFS